MQVFAEWTEMISGEGPGSCEPMGFVPNKEQNAALPGEEASPIPFSPSINEILSAISQSNIQVKYLNNRVEGDHTPMKKLIDPGLGFGSFNTVRKTIRGYETMRMIKKGRCRQLGIRLAVRQSFSIHFSELQFSLSAKASSCATQFLHQSPLWLNHVSLLSLKATNRLTAEIGSGSVRAVARDAIFAIENFYLAVIVTVESTTCSSPRPPSPQEWLKIFLEATVQL